MLFELGLDSLKELDGGRIKVAFEQELQTILRDLHDRPGLTAARKLGLIVSLKPVVDEQGELYNVDISLDVTSKMPARKTGTYPMQVRTSRGGLMAVFNELSLDNPDQGTLDFDK